jgi:predicted metal-dependent hydrolase
MRHSTDNSVSRDFTFDNGGRIAYYLTWRPYSRSIRLHITPQHGLSVSASKSISLKRIEGFIREKQPWIQKHLQALENARESLEVAQNAPLPREIVFPAIGETWPVIYRSTNAKAAMARTHGTTVIVSGDIADSRACKAALRRWQVRRAKTALTAWLKELADANGLQYVDAHVKPMRSRWGSCSSKGFINLNSKLLFLQPDMARSVLLHELCHTRELNHGKKFKALLQNLAPDIDAIERQMKQAWQTVPAWADARIAIPLGNSR